MKEVKEMKKLTVSISPELHDKIKKHGYNANRLINQLLKKHIGEKEK